MTVDVLADWGGLDVEVGVPSAATVGIDCEWGGLDVTVMAYPHDHGSPVPGPAPMMALFDETNNYISSLPGVRNIKWQHGITNVGFLTCHLPTDATQTAGATAKRWLKVYYKGHSRQAARIDGHQLQAAVDTQRAYVEFNEIPGALNVLGDAVVYPEYGLDRSSSPTRTYGWMSRDLDHASGNFTHPTGVPFDSDSGYRHDKPDGLGGISPSPQWIAKDTPYTIVPAGKRQWHRRRWVASAGFQWVILATADTHLTLWVDGELAISADQQSAGLWAGLTQITGEFDAGVHVLAAEVQNTKVRYRSNPVAFILAMQRTDPKTGDPIHGSAYLVSDSRWFTADEYPGWQRAAVIANQFDEAAGRAVNAFNGVLNRGFTYTADSAGNAWDDTPDEYNADVGGSLLDFFLQMADQKLDLVVTPGALNFNAYKRLGMDLSSTVMLDLGKNGGNILTHEIDVTEGRFNAALVQLADGTWTERTHDDSISQFGRAEVGVSLGSTSDTDSAHEVADGQFDETAHVARTFTVTHSGNFGVQPYDDYNPGDTIGVPNEHGTSYFKARVMNITFDHSTDQPVITPELQYDRTT